MIANGLTMFIGMWIGALLVALIGFVFDLAATHHAICDDDEWTADVRRRVEIDRWFRDVGQGGHAP